MQGFKESVFLEHFERVMNGTSIEEMTGGNMCYLKINYFNFRSKAELNILKEL